MTSKLPLRIPAIILSSLFLTACNDDSDGTKADPGLETGADGQNSKDGAESDLKPDGSAEDDAAGFSRPNLPTFQEAIAKIVQIDGKETPCAGALVTPTQILTAADCLRRAPFEWAGKTTLQTVFDVEMQVGFDKLSKVRGTGFLRGQSSVRSDKTRVIKATLKNAVAAAEKEWAEYKEKPAHKDFSVKFPLSDAFLGNVYTAVSVNFHDDYWTEVSDHFQSCIGLFAIPKKATYTDTLNIMNMASKNFAKCLANENASADLAVLTLAEPVEGITPLEIATPRMAETYLVNGATVVLAGFSNRESTGEAINTFPSTPVEFTLDCGDEGCGQDPIWVKGDPGASCDGDTGGPLLIPTKDGPLVVGVASPHPPKAKTVQDGQATCSAESSFARIDRAAAWYRQE